MNGLVHGALSELEGLVHGALSELIDPEQHVCA